MQFSRLIPLYFVKLLEPQSKYIMFRHPVCSRYCRALLSICRSMQEWWKTTLLFLFRFLRNTNPGRQIVSNFNSLQHFIGSSCNGPQDSFHQNMYDTVSIFPRMLLAMLGVGVNLLAFEKNRLETFRRGRCNINASICFVGEIKSRKHAELVVATGGYNLSLHTLSNNEERPLRELYSFQSDTVDDWIRATHLVKETKSKMSLAVGFSHNRVELWTIDLSSQSREVSFRSQCQDRSLLYSMCFFGSGLHDLTAVCGTVFNQILLWKVYSDTFEDQSLPGDLIQGCEKLSQQKVVQRITGHDGVVFDVQCDADGSQIYSVSDDRTLRVWRKISGEYINQFAGFSHTSRVWRCLAPPSLPLVFSSGEDSTVRVWSKTSGKHISTLSGHSAGIWSLAYCPKTQILATGGGDSTIRFWSSRRWGEVGHVNTNLSVPTKEIYVANLRERTCKCVLLNKPQVRAISILLAAKMMIKYENFSHMNKPGIECLVRALYSSIAEGHQIIVLTNSQHT